MGDDSNDDRGGWPEHDIPPHLAPLFEGPVELPANEEPEALSAVLASRLEALLSLYGCAPTPAGWKRLALTLAMEHEIAGSKILEVRDANSPAGGEGGRPPGEHWANFMRLKALRRKHRTNADAADALARELRRQARARNGGREAFDVPSAKTIANWFSSPPSAPVEVERHPLKLRALEALTAAARRLENSRKPPGS